MQLSHIFSKDKAFSLLSFKHGLQMRLVAGELGLRAEPPPSIVKLSSSQLSWGCFHPSMGRSPRPEFGGLPPQPAIGSRLAVRVYHLLQQQGLDLHVTLNSLVLLNGGTQLKSGKTAKAATQAFVSDRAPLPMQRPRQALKVLKMLWPAVLDFGRLCSISAGLADTSLADA